MVFQRGGKCLGILTLIALSGQALALTIREDIGVLKIHDLLLRPTFQLQEPQDGEFSVGESSFALRWELAEVFSGVIRIGPRTLMNPVSHYTSAVDDDVTLVEAFAEFLHPYGRFRMGRLPIEFGYEGRQWERELIFPRSLLFERRAMMLRDVGFSYDITHNNFFTGFVIHNGESDQDVDGRIWYTARWGYRTEKFELGMAGQTGSTKPTSTSLSGDNLAGVDVTKEAKWRTSGVYTAIHNKDFDWITEFYIGERIQEENLGKFLSGHTDMSYEFSKLFSGHLRYDHFDPDTNVKGNSEREISLGFMLSNSTRSSNLILVGTKAIEDKNFSANDSVLLIWSLSPSGIVRF